MSRGLIAVLLVLTTTAFVRAQQGQQPAAPGGGQGAGRGGPGAPAPTVTGRAQAPYDPSGYWVALVTDDWRYRMLTPPKGNADYMPVNAEARKVMDALGSGEGRSRRGGVSRVRRRRNHASSGPPAHHVGRRQHARRWIWTPARRRGVSCSARRRRRVSLRGRESRRRAGCFPLLDAAAGESGHRLASSS